MRRPRISERTDIVRNLLRECAPQVLGRLAHRYGQFDVAEDAVQDALAKAAAVWKEDGLPDNPVAWLYTVASNRLIDIVRSEAARRNREREYVRDHLVASETKEDPLIDDDDTLDLLFLCCHESLSVPSQIALTLRAVGGLSTAEIARAYLVPEATMAQRISRAKQTIKAAGAEFGRVESTERHDRLEAVESVLYLMFNEGYTATMGADLVRVDLSAEAIRLARELVRMLPGHGEAVGLLCLMLLTDARRPARTTRDGEFIPLDEQDRGRWDTGAIAEATEILVAALKTSVAGPYLVQAAIAAVHDEAPSTADTDWEEVLHLYNLLNHMVSNPIVKLNRAVAIAMVDGAPRALLLLDELQRDPAIGGHYRLVSVRAHLLEMVGDTAAARDAYRSAARSTLSLPERKYLLRRASRI